MSNEKCKKKFNYDKSVVKWTKKVWNMNEKLSKNQITEKWKKNEWMKKLKKRTNEVGENLLKNERKYIKKNKRIMEWKMKERMTENL